MKDMLGLADDIDAPNRYTCESLPPTFGKPVTLSAVSVTQHHYLTLKELASGPLPKTDGLPVRALLDKVETMFCLQALMGS